MKRYDEKCPVCGARNKNLYLEETDGCFECERCKNKINLFSCKFKTDNKTEMQVKGK